MNKLKLMAVLVATALVVSFSLATGEKAEPVGKPRFSRNWTIADWKLVG